MSVIGSNILAGASSSQGYQISRSVRLRSSASAYFNRTFGSNGNQQQWTWSGWTKAGRFGSQQPIFNAYSSATNYGLFAFSASGFISATDTLKFYTTISNVSQAALQTAAVFRDPSAWYHVVLQVDTTQATSTNRIRIYVNGVLQTLTGTQPSQNANIGFFNTTSVPHQIGSLATGTYGYYDGYLTEINFIDGQALTPSSFGETNAVTGVWQPKKYAGTYGTNGFYLNFSDNSAATAAAIGKDYSGNGNNWTPNNISVTAGVTYDSMLDVPTLWADGGNGRGNYATWSPIDHPTTFIAPTNGNLSQNCNTAAWTLCVPTFAIPDGSGLWQWELVQTGTANGANAIGVCLTTVQASVTGAPSSRAGCSGVDNVGTTFINGATSGSITYPTVGNTITCLYDATNRTFQVFDNGTSRGTITGLPAGDVRPFVAASSSNGSPTFVANFGQTTFAYNQGGKALNTLNLPTPTILKGNQYFDATTYTGNSGTQSVVNSGAMQPDLVWIKNRSVTSQHVLTDSVRGVDRQLFSSLTNAEQTSATGITSLNSNGFTTGANPSPTGSTNSSPDAFIAWQWKEGATQGFDIVAFTGTGTNTTVAHNLGVAPAMMIVKNRSVGATGWPVYHKNANASPASGGLRLNLTDAFVTYSPYWNNTAPTSSVFSLGTDNQANGNGNNMIAYLFAEVAGFSKFGSYVGNGSADGPFVFCGFRPRFVMVKRTDAAVSWIVIDTARNTYNVSNFSLLPNSAGAEITSSTEIDVLSNGFKIRTTDVSLNANGGTYIFAAFSEVGFKYALGR